MRLTAGIGGGWTHNNVPPDSELAPLGDENYSGAAGFFSFDIGTAVVENLMLHARLSSFALIEPHVRVDGRDLGRLTDVTIDHYMLGAGLTYYFMPINIYVTGVIGLAGMSFSFSGHDYDMDPGWGIEVDIGKEWWVAHQWGIGVALRSAVVRTREDNLNFGFTTLAFGALLSVTYQ